ncbi:hypothetical protein R70723_32490 [Paenibacillus sp. FSL R7-0273]|uniref:DUF4446 family protein n=1 Tax=Paenibacillus sp. FSL R7-0273 TaxID=1536772 RepID=UPI0004F5B82C|nr:DUF4446 family protein [Paenibacillus sp. FSL R7-0273]AIQ50079.1 hypothetical protein R70723_32490 [Paenibacillus sp. FSL R7-0273]OMF90951.1 hypothetical protein BK144_16935 [Paenibacillus sp. FSL R7-0273]
MLELNQMINEQISLVIFAAAVIILILVIVQLVQGSKLRRMRRKYDAMMNGNGVEDLESLLIDLKNQSERLDEGQREHKALIEAAQSKMRGMKSKVAVKRYNAFGERGSDLSFSIAIVDDNSNGVVLTSLHNRENSYIYAKPLENGASQYPLSPEEKEVIAQAQQQS